MSSFCWELKNMRGALCILKLRREFVSNFASPENFIYSQRRTVTGLEELQPKHNYALVFVWGVYL